MGQVVEGRERVGLVGGNVPAHRSAAKLLFIPVLNNFHLELTEVATWARRPTLTQLTQQMVAHQSSEAYLMGFFLNVKGHTI